MGPNPKNLIRPAGICKIAEFVLALTITFMTRFGGTGDNIMLIGESQDSTAFGYMTVFGYCFITAIAIVGCVLGEDYNVQNLAFAFLGAIFYITTGAIQLKFVTKLMPNHATMNAMGAFCIIQGVVFFCDLGAMAWQAKRDRD